MARPLPRVVDALGYLSPTRSLPGREEPVYAVAPNSLTPVFRWLVRYGRDRADRDNHL